MPVSPLLAARVNLDSLSVTRNAGFTLKNGPRQRVLVAHADVKSSWRMASAFRHAGFEVSVAESTDEAARQIAEKIPDFILLESALPGSGSAHLCKWIRTEQDLPDTRIIMLGDGPGNADEGFALDSGADDYLEQPFEMADLFKKVSALQHRRRVDRLKHILKAGSIEMVQDQWVVNVDGAAANLTETEYRLLQELLEVNGRVLTRDDLLERVWGYQRAFNIESRTLDVHMSRLRHKLGTSAKNLITVRNVGYRISITPDLVNQ